MSSRRLRIAAVAGLLLLARAGLAGGDGAALERLRKAFDGASTATERLEAARGAAGLDGRPAAEAACAALESTLGRAAVWARRRSEIRDRIVEITGEKAGAEQETFPIPILREIQSLKAEEDALTSRDVEEREIADLLRGLLASFRDLRALDHLASLAGRPATPSEARVALLDALATAGGDAAGRAARAALRDRNAVVREAAIGALARLKPREEETLRSLAAALADERWTVRLAAARRLADVASPGAVDLLVARLPAEDGRVQKDLSDLLRGLTGQRFGPDPEGWAHWWRENRAAFASGERTLAAGGAAAPADEGGAEGATYYGIATPSKRILYVIDISGSMAKPSGADEKRARVEDAKKELQRSVRALSAGSAFTIYAFHDTVSKWKPALVGATAAAKDEARGWIDALGASSWTNTYAALEEAIRASAADPRNAMGADYAVAADTIFLLTDGAPTTPGGKARDEKGNPEHLRVLAAVRDWNREKRVAIHTVGVGPEINSEFLATLARENGGQFVRVR